MAAAAVVFALAVLAGCIRADVAADPAAPQAVRVPQVSPRPVTKLLVFVVENRSLRQMLARMPYTASLARRFGYAADYRAIAHPSLPNYLAIAGGSTFGVSDDLGPLSHPLRGRTVFGQALALGRTAKVYAEGMPSRCALADGGNRYAARHNPWTYFVRERRACRSHDVPMSAFGATWIEAGFPTPGWSSRTCATTPMTARCLPPTTGCAPC